MAEIDVHNFNFLPLSLASTLLLQRYKCPLLCKLTSTLFRTRVLRHFPPSWLFHLSLLNGLKLRSEIVCFSEFHILNISEFFSNLSTCVLVGFGYNLESGLARKKKVGTCSPFPFFYPRQVVSYRWSKKYHFSFTLSC